MNTIYEERKAGFETVRDQLRRLLAQDDPNLEVLASTAQQLDQTASLLRHNLPERANEVLHDLDCRDYRYHLVWPDGERYSFTAQYAQRPAALRHLVAVRRTFPEMKLYDNRERVFVEPPTDDR